MTVQAIAPHVCPRWCRTCEPPSDPTDAEASYCHYGPPRHLALAALAHPLTIQQSCFAHPTGIRHSVIDITRHDRRGFGVTGDEAHTLADLLRRPCLHYRSPSATMTLTETPIEPLVFTIHHLGTDPRDYSLALDQGGEHLMTLSLPEASTLADILTEWAPTL